MILLQLIAALFPVRIVINQNVDGRLFDKAFNVRLCFVSDTFQQLECVWIFNELRWPAISFDFSFIATNSSSLFIERRFTLNFDWVSINSEQSGIRNAAGDDAKFIQLAIVQLARVNDDRTAAIIFNLRATIDRAVVQLNHLHPTVTIMASLNSSNYIINNYGLTRRLNRNIIGNPNGIQWTTRTGDWNAIENENSNKNNNSNNKAKKKPVTIWNE